MSSTKREIRSLNPFILHVVELNKITIDIFVILRSLLIQFVVLEEIINIISPIYHERALVLYSLEKFRSWFGGGFDMTFGKVKYFLKFSLNIFEKLQEHFKRMFVSQIRLTYLEVDKFHLKGY